MENFTFRVVFSDGETLRYLCCGTEALVVSYNFHCCDVLYREDWHLLRVEMTLRDFILKISACESVLGPANEGNVLHDDVLTRTAWVVQDCSPC